MSMPTPPSKPAPMPFANAARPTFATPAPRVPAPAPKQGGGGGGKDGANPYLRTKVLTAGPAELRLMLFDGGLKFARQARRLMDAEKPDLEAIFESSIRAQKIVLELSSSLTRDNGDDLYEKLSALYHFIYTHMVDANMTKDKQKLDEAIRLLAYERETWVMAMDEMAKAAA